MRTLLGALACMLSVMSIAQGLEIDYPSNSFAEFYKIKYPRLKYQYHEKEQTHDYSGNWDFDDDGHKDTLFFVGNGGAHLYYHLVLKLSSENERRAFPMLSVDMPILEWGDTLQKYFTVSQSIPQFVVHDFNGDRRPEIYLNVAGGENNPELGFRHVVLYYSEGNILMRRFEP